MEKFTVCLWPGAGYVLFPFEVLAENEEDALKEAVKRSLNEEYSILGFEATEENIKEKIEYYEEEFKEYEDEYDFIEQFLNYNFIDEMCYYLNMDNTRIEKGWGKYNNSIPLEEEQTYKIIRFYKELDKPREIIKTGLTLEEAKEHCSKPETQDDFGRWFDGFEKE